MLATRTRCAVQGCANPQNGLSDKCHRHDAIETRAACERCGVDGGLSWVDGMLLCTSCGFVCDRCGDRGGRPHEVTWYDHETGPQAERGCTGCLSDDVEGAA